MASEIEPHGVSCYDNLVTSKNNLVTIFSNEFVTNLGRAYKLCYPLRQGKKTVCLLKKTESEDYLANT
jgi:hypothetical protein